MRLFFGAVTASFSLGLLLDGRTVESQWYSLGILSLWIPWTTRDLLNYHRKSKLAAACAARKDAEWREKEGKKS